jgi:tetratricopeptide (TPR) repeat protein
MGLKKETTKDLLLVDIERALACGEWVHDREMQSYIDGVTAVKKRVDSLVRKGESLRAIPLYVVFMAGCEAKMEDTSAEGIEIEMVFKDLFFSWIRARQKAQCDDAETVRQMLRMIDKDDYGLCRDIEDDIAANVKGSVFDLFVSAIYARFEKEVRSDVTTEAPSVYARSWPVRQNADILTGIYKARRNLKGYLEVCGKIGFTPKDCEAVAQIYVGRKRWREALEYVDSGLELEQGKIWPNYSAQYLSSMKCELLKHLGRNDEALQFAWQDFQRVLGESEYFVLMKYVPEQKKKDWHSKALELSRAAGIDRYIGLCLLTNELELLAAEIERVDAVKLGDVFHDTACRVAEALFEAFPLASLKIYRVLALQILNRGKSKYYSYAIGYLRKVKALYQRVDLEREWGVFAQDLSVAYQGKPAFMSKFRLLLSGREEERMPTFEERMQRRWEKKLSEETVD